MIWWIDFAIVVILSTLFFGSLLCCVGFIVHAVNDRAWGPAVAFVFLALVVLMFGLMVLSQSLRNSHTQAERSSKE